jgi:hypothetical protein
VNDFFIHRQANVAGIFAIPQKCALRAMRFNAAGSEFVNLAGGDTRLNERGNFLQHRGGNFPRGSHRLDVTLTLENDHDPLTTSALAFVCTN